MKICPACNNLACKIIYYGFPMGFCEDCEVVFGFWSYLAAILPFEGAFFVYESSYIYALWSWLTDREKDL